jgi:exodeoxyribonuclease V alpha subunit
MEMMMDIYANDLENSTPTADRIRLNLLSIQHVELSPFIEYFDLSPIDYMSIEDLLELGDYDRDPILIFMLMNLYAAMREGSVCILLVSTSFIFKFPAKLRPAAQNFLECFIDALDRQKYNRLISQDPNAFVPLIWVKQPTPRLYFQKYYVCETDLKKKLLKFLEFKERRILPPINAAYVVEDLYSPESTIRIRPNGPPIVRDRVQMQALIMGLTLRLTIISGGPGTGKTSLMVNLLRGVLRCKIDADKIILGAPTGRAAQRMTEAIGSQMATINRLNNTDTLITRLKGATIHRILKYDPSRHSFHYNAKRLLPARMIIIDEVSMVDLVMMSHLIKAVDPETTRLVFLGDKNQLPSVEAGAVLADLIPQTNSSNRFKDHLVILKTVFRSGRELIHLAEKINSGKMPSVTPLDIDKAMEDEQKGWAFVSDADKRKLPGILSKWIQKQYIKAYVDSKKSYIELVQKAGEFTSYELEHTEAGHLLLSAIFAEVEKTRILTLTRLGAFGCEMANALLKRMMIRAVGGKYSLHTDVRLGLFSGAQIIIRRNDYSKELFNGDMGVVLMDVSGIIKIYFQRATAFMGYSTDMLPPFELAFALTVHKSQGSEYEKILLLLPDDMEHRLLTKEMLYTAVTRAQKQVVIYGRKEVFEKAITRSILRQTGMLR